VEIPGVQEVGVDECREEKPDPERRAPLCRALVRSVRWLKEGIGWLAIGEGTTPRIDARAFCPAAIRSFSGVGVPDSQRLRFGSPP